MFRCPGYRPLGWLRTGLGFNDRCRYLLNNLNTYHLGGGFCIHPSLQFDPFEIHDCPYSGGIPGLFKRAWGFLVWVWTDWPLWKKALWTGAIGVGTTLLALLGAWWIYS